MTRGFAVACVLLPVIIMGLAGRALAQTEPDTTLGGYLRTLSDSTSTYFGTASEPADTAGLDSIRAYALANPWRDMPRRQRPMSLTPDFTFNRVDGPVYGAIARLGVPDDMLGRLRGDVGYAVGPKPDLWLGGARYIREVYLKPGIWSVTLDAGKRTEIMDRDRPDRRLSSLSAFLTGEDHKHYLQRKGFSGGIGLETETAWLEANYRDEDETARVTTATWTLFGYEAAEPFNIPATEGRARELELFGQWRLPLTPVIAEATYATSGNAIGSDFEYRRTRLAASADVGLGKTFSIVPQASYGWFEGDMIPQQAFYLGGQHSLRSIQSTSLGGTHMALARLSLVYVRDILELMHLPHPAMFPVQAGVFGASGATWGPDPDGGPTRPGSDWPDDKSAWKSEIGLGVFYQPGVPSPLTQIGFNATWGIGPNTDRRISVSITRALDLVRSRKLR